MAILKNTKPLRVAIIGCGGFGNFHITNLLKMENIEIVALYNRGIENLEKTGKRVPKARMYQDAEKMISKEKIDMAVVSVIPDAHGEIEELCCKKGIHMYVEKPLTISMDTANKINECIKYSNIITSVGYQERYSSAIGIIREILQKEPVGLVQAYWIGAMPGVQWWRLKEKSGGQIVEQTTHIVDMLRYLLGEVDTVFGFGACDERFNSLAHTVEDYSSCVLKFKNGTIASLQSACYVKDGVGKEGFEIVTPRCKIEYSWGRSLKVTSGERSEELKVLNDRHFDALDTFVKAVKSGDRIDIKSPYEDALKTLEVTLKANSSIETGIAVKIN